jgi:cell division protein FtsI/penicillin-binding protein 2
MSRRWWIATAVLALVATGVFACGKDDGPDRSLRSFLTAWHDGKLGGQKLVDAGGADLAGAAAQTQLTGLEGDLAARRPELKVGGKPNVRKNDATSVVKVSWPVADGVTWEYPTTVRLSRRKDQWIPVFSPQTVHPDLTGSEKLTAKRTSAERAGILDGSGQPIVTNRPVKILGVEPQRVTDVTALVGTLKSIFAEIGVDVGVDDLPGRVRAAKPDAFVQVVTLRKEDYDKGESSFRRIVGLHVRDGVEALAPSRVFARALLGQVGEVTKEIMDKNPGKYQVGDRAGTSGLQQRYDERLRGKPGVSVVAGQRKLWESAPAPGQAVKTTIDPKIQNAADGALAGEKLRASIVVVRVSDGAVVAAANGPGAAPLNLAFTAQVAPGSTMKTMSALGLLDAGAVGVDTPVDCPATINVGGTTFKNAHDLALGKVPFRTDFAKSCNTAFAGLASKLGPDGLYNTSKSVGIGVPWDLGADVFTGKVAQGETGAAQAQAAFGQGTSQVSPVALAGAAAAIARGQWKQPTLVLDPAPAAKAPDASPLKAEPVGALRTMMREVVTSGTATALKGLPGEPVHGKTGTAEFGDNNPDNTHSWFMGWKGDLAFAVFVEKGGASTDSAVPITGKFFLALGV